MLIEFLGEEFDGTLGCDYFSAYRKFMGKMSGSVQFCFAHLIRDLKFLAEHPEPMMPLYAQPILRTTRKLFQLIHEQVKNPEVDFQSKLERQNLAASARQLPPGPTALISISKALAANKDVTLPDSLDAKHQGMVDIQSRPLLRTLCRQLRKIKR